MSYEDFPDEEHEVNVYGHEAREALEENDEISPEEGAFMEGYDSDEEDEELEEELDEDELPEA
ncbi:MAG: hypothetical protein OXR66_01265 [Candidatus Woesearchaeota archaeon]|nr:hypothetical protein [Candidatus Woesearchaeota archaeon]